MKIIRNISLTFSRRNYLQKSAGYERVVWCKWRAESGKRSIFHPESHSPSLKQRVEKGKGKEKIFQQNPGISM